MSFFDALNISASGLTADRVQLDVTASNLANAQSTNDGEAYTPEAVDLTAVGAGQDAFSSELSSALQSAGISNSSDATPGGVEVTGIVKEKVADQLVYDPSSAEANKEGYVEEPDVQPVTEMTNMIAESDDYQANVTAMETTKTMYSSTLDLLR